MFKAGSSYHHNNRRSGHHEQRDRERVERLERERERLHRERGEITHYDDEDTINERSYNNAIEYSGRGCNQFYMFSSSLLISIYLFFLSFLYSLPSMKSTIFADFM